ncbi:MAG: TetR/AcrR family transcriptional regulator [Candidatus Marinimicrobia bacterium]|nr:TetR/AcrR family transcriptional regulator [Candidatus Neomarinimicrobiota bacterium]
MQKISLKKEKILNAARELIDKIGPDKITMELIAKRIEMGKASIYYYFKSKEEIISEVASEEGRKIQREVYKAIQEETNPVDKLRAYMITRVKFMKELAGYYGGKKLQKELHKYHFAFEAFQKQFYDFEQNILHVIIETGLEKGVFEIEDTTIATGALLSAMRGIEYQWTFYTDLDEALTQAGVLFRILLNGILKR